MHVLHCIKHVHLGLEGGLDTVSDVVSMLTRQKAKGLNILPENRPTRVPEIIPKTWVKAFSENIARTGAGVQGPLRMPLGRDPRFTPQYSMSRSVSWIRKETAEKKNLQFFIGLDGSLTCLCARPGKDILTEKEITVFLKETVHSIQQEVTDVNWKHCTSLVPVHQPLPHANHSKVIIQVLVFPTRLVCLYLDSIITPNSKNHTFRIKAGVSSRVYQEALPVYYKVYTQPYVIPPSPTPAPPRWKLQSPTTHATWLRYRGAKWILVAVLMGGHHRLGKNSPLMVLDTFLLTIIAKMGVSDPDLEGVDFFGVIGGADVPGEPIEW